MPKLKGQVLSLQPGNKSKALLEKWLWITREITRKLLRCYFVHKNPVIKRLLKEIICSCTLKWSCVFMILNKIGAIPEWRNIVLPFVLEGLKMNSGESN